MAVSAHVAIVDDELELRATLAEDLAVHGLRVSARAGGEALPALLLTGAAPDRVLLDLRRPREGP